MSTPDPLTVWDTAAEDLLVVLRDLDAADVERPTGLPGWRVREVLAHLAHLESEVAGMPQPPGGRVEVEAARNQPMPTAVTEAGVTARDGLTAAELLEEFELACHRRREVLAGLGTEPKAPAPGLCGDLGWDLRTLLRNRPIDLWVHEQDIRRATGRAMAMDSVGAAHVAAVMAAAFPAALRRQPVGTAVVARISGPQGRVLAARVGEDGRAAPFDPSEGSDVTLEMDDATWLSLTGGRLVPAEADVAVTGDAEVAKQVLTKLNVTP